jgi:6-phosphogluconolactonase (cycloisomerase 2 family)
MLNLIPHEVSDDIDFDYRTEDIKFSPSGRRLVIVATEGCILVFKVNLKARPIEVVFEQEIRSTRLLVPHGIDFITEDIVVVANRDADLAFYSIPPPSTKLQHRAMPQFLDPLNEFQSEKFGRTGFRRELRGRPLYCGPGSVRIFNNILYVCCNFKNTVSAHKYSIEKKSIHVQGDTLIMHDGLEVIDGLAFSKDGQYLAVSDHDHNRIVVSRRIENISDATDLPMSFEYSCSLRDKDMHYPHGLCFDFDGQRIFAGDAGGRLIHVFETSYGWSKDMSSSIEKPYGVDQSAFLKSRAIVDESVRNLEGGAKGLDIDQSTNILVVTTRHQVLRFFEISTVTR